MFKNYIITNLSFVDNLHRDLIDGKSEKLWKQINDFLSE